MTDDVDRADREIERNLAEAARMRKPVGPAPKGTCHWCDEPVTDQRRWCDVECREAWERLTRPR